MLPSVVAHMDLDSFFVSVERLKNPDLIGKPVIVGATGNRGVVSSCSYEARKLGVHSAMAISKARACCPDGIFLAGDFSAYSFYSKKVKQIVSDNLPLFEFASIDEFYCDLSGFDKFMDGPFVAAQRLRRKIIEQTGLPISMCVASTKTTAKIGTGFAKPNGELYLKPENERQFLANLPIEEIPMLGPKMAGSLHKMGIFTIGDLQKMDAEALAKRLGKWGTVLWKKANGVYYSPMESCRERKSISAESTFFEDTASMELLEAKIVSLCERLGHQLRKEGLYATNVGIKLRFSDFTTISRQMVIPATNSEQPLIAGAKELFQAAWVKGTPIRLIGVKLGELTNTPAQLLLFETTPVAHTKVLQSADAIRNKFGKLAIRRAVTLKG